MFGAYVFVVAAMRFVFSRLDRAPRTLLVKIIPCQKTLLVVE